LDLIGKDLIRDKKSLVSPWIKKSIFAEKRKVKQINIKKLFG
jgi:hypothetical protein